ncbi:MAG: hypothetical protein H6704_21885 [Myxococcales bacterium]|nr:hypothetical protein [Myxococcales bacterium]MCB9538893.1 hypothetical protein [Myxococcales bacterium]
MFLTPVIWAVLSMLVWATLALTPPAYAPVGWAASVLCATLVVATWVVLQLDRRHPFPVPPRIWRAPAPWMLGAAAVAGLGFTIFASELGNIVLSMQDAPLAAPPPDAGRGVPWVNALVVGLIHPVCLLLVAQGVVQRVLLLARFGPWIVVALTAVIASIGDLFGVWPQRVFMLGLPAWLYLRSLSLGLALAAYLPGRLIAAALELGFRPGIPGFDLVAADAVLFQPIWFDLLGAALVVAGVAPLLAAMVAARRDDAEPDEADA